MTWPLHFIMFLPYLLRILPACHTWSHCRSCMKWTKYAFESPKKDCLSAPLRLQPFEPCKICHHIQLYIDLLLDQCTLLDFCNPAGRFRISRSTDKLVQLVHQAARDAAASHSPALAQSLIAAVTQVAELAASLPPQAHAKQMQVDVPACALRKPHGFAKMRQCFTSASNNPLSRILWALHRAASKSEHGQCAPRSVCLT